MKTIGIVSDTHGLLRKSAEKALRGVDAIIHAGDVGTPEVLKALGKIAPVHAVRGNMDRGGFGSSLPVSEMAIIGKVAFYVLHDIASLDLDPQAAGISAVLYGHSHEPSLKRENGVLYINPGSIGPRRFTLPISLATVVLDDSNGNVSLDVRFVELKD